MEHMHFDYKTTCQTLDPELNQLKNRLQPEIERMIATRESDYTTDYGSINLPFDQEMLTKVATAAKDKRFLNPTALVVIGIGGSNLGTIAVLESLRGKFYNEHHDVKVYFVDTVDADHVNDIAQLVEHHLTTGNNIVINVISKSGSTTETIANFEIFLEILKNHRPYNYHQFVVATTDNNSCLWQLGTQEEFTLLEIPEHVGGRYSVFSPVGLFPLCFLEIDIKDLVEGAQSGCEMGTRTKVDGNYAAISAALLAHHYQNGIIIHDTFIFSVALESLGLWYRQLSAESIGKAHDRDGAMVNIGLLPTISIGSTDLHSVAQLYLAGPANRFTTFVNVADNQSNIILPDYEEFESLVESIQNKSLSTIMSAILQGTRQAYLNDKRPFVSWTIPEKSAYYVGQFMQLKMLEIMYLGFLLNVNPFDQPEIEKYKKETRNVLKS